MGLTSLILLIGGISVLDLPGGWRYVGHVALALSVVLSGLSERGISATASWRQLVFFAVVGIGLAWTKAWALATYCVAYGAAPFLFRWLKQNRP